MDIGGVSSARRVASVPVNPEPDEQGTIVITRVVMEGTSLERYVGRYVEQGRAHPDRLTYSRHRC